MSAQYAPADGAHDRSLRVVGYEGARPDIQALVPAGVTQVLELGCSTGVLGEALKQRSECAVTGIEYDPAFAVEAQGRLDRVYCVDANTFFESIPQGIGTFDCLIAADLLEHLSDPWNTFSNAAQLLEPGGTAIVSVPNVLHWHALKRIVTEDRWPREDVGVFDRTHLRWFTERDIRDLLENAGLVDVKMLPQLSESGWRRSLAELALGSRLGRFAPAKLAATARMPE